MTVTATLADLAAASPHAVRILEQYRLDYCCGGSRPFEDACLAQGLDPAAVLAEIDRAAASAPSTRDWQAAPIAELVRHVVETHHSYLRRELPALSARLQKVVSVHGARDPQVLPRLAGVFASLRAELEMHLHKEEAILFPCIVQYGFALLQHRPMPAMPFGSIANPIAMMEHEHSGAGDALSEIRSLTHNYQPPDYACATVRALFEGLQALEADLHLHIHLENNILFPRAIALEQSPV